MSNKICLNIKQKSLNIKQKCMPKYAAKMLKYSNFNITSKCISKYHTLLIERIYEINEVKFYFVN